MNNEREIHTTRWPGLSAALVFGSLTRLLPFLAAAFHVVEAYLFIRKRGRAKESLFLLSFTFRSEQITESTITMFTAVVEPLQWNTTVFLKWGDGKHQWTLSDIKIWWWLIYFSRVCKKRFPIGLSWSFVYFNLHSLCDSPYISVKGLLIGNTFSYL